MDIIFINSENSKTSHPHLLFITKSFRKNKLKEKVTNIIFN